MKKFLAALALCIFGAAYSTAQVPGLFIASPIGTEQINVLNQGPQIASVFLSQVRDAAGYQKSTPISPFTATFTNNQSLMVILGGSTLANGTINLAASPRDGQMNCFYTKPIVTTLALAAPGGATINDPVTTTTATTRYCYLYSASNTTWDRFQ